jgi:hypothetical protein
LDVAHAWGVTDVRQTSLGCEESGDERDDPGRDYANRLRWGATFQVKAGKPKRKVELGVSDCSAIPVNENGLTASAKAQVV